MKARLLVLLNLVFLQTLDLLGQQTGALGNLLFQDTLSLIPIHGFISIPDTTNNIWKVGYPSSEIIDSTYTGKEAILTEDQTADSNDSLDYFLISIPAADSSWGEGILSFYHNYDMDSLINGGLIEVSYDNGATWKNILDDISHINYNYIGIYSETDTILGAVPAFTGKSHEWMYSELYWHWVALTKKAAKEYYGTPLIRFRFEYNSDLLITNTWIIDGIVLRGYSIVGAVGSQNTTTVNVYPNPASNDLRVQISSAMENLNYEIYNFVGLKVYESQLNTAQIDISILGSGIYLLVIKNEGRIIASTKFLKN